MVKVFSDYENGSYVDERRLIGDIRIVTADSGFRREGPLEDRKVNLNRGGGSILDVGVYPLAFASMVFGKSPKQITGITIVEEI